MLVFTILLLLSATQLNGLPQGAPPSACESMLPNHSGGIPPQTEITPYSVIPTRQSDIVVTITSNVGVPFQGYMLQARTPSKEILGTFSSNPDGRLLNCSAPFDTITHNSPQDKASIDFVWTPPQNFEGTVIFTATIAQSYDTFWVGVESKPFEVRRGFTGTDPPRGGGSRLQTTTPPYYTPEEARSSGDPQDPFYDGCAETKLCFGVPEGCLGTRSCRAAVAVTVMGDKYDFEVKARENAAWVGVGLSADSKMGDDSVIECAKKPSGGLDAYMSWTSGSPNYGVQRLSNSQLGIQLLNSSSLDGTIYCKVRRDLVTNVNGKTFDLANEKYFLLVASGSNVAANKVQFHDLVFESSGKAQSLSDISALGAASKLLIRLHGCFMLAAWIGTASIGILLARYFRQTWVGSSLCGKDIWFAWHRNFMILTWALTVTGFVLIFVELRAWSQENNPHAILGTVTTALCVLQPIGAYFRPHPGASKRPLFNWLHWMVGNAAHIVAIVTLFFAVKLTKAELPDYVDYILAAFVAFHAVVHIILSIMGCISEKASERRVTSFPMKDLNGSGRNSSYTDRNADSPYGGFRKFILALYIIIVLALLVVLILITALAPIEETWKTIRATMKSR